MFKFKITKGQQSTSEAAKSAEDFFSFSKLSTLGFPYKPTSLAWDPILCLMAIGSQNGSIRIYGAPGVQFCGQLRQKLCITSLMFVPRKARLISLCSDNSLHLWELNERSGIWYLEEVKSFILRGLMKKITEIHLNSTSDILYLGTMCGNIYTLDVETFEMAESVIYQDVVIQNIPDDKKIKQGSVKVILEQPGNSNCILIGYQQGLIVLWDINKLIVVSMFLGSQTLESVAWYKDGIKFMSSHGDGSYVVWSTEDSSKPAEIPITPYGPFACKLIDKILWKSTKGREDYIIFSGGMPRSNYGDKCTVTIMSGDRHQVLDLSTNVIDFFTISEALNESDFDNPHSLVILLEEELVVIDLESDTWLPFRYPYLDIPHSSQITCFQYCPNVHKDLWKNITSIRTIETEQRYSTNEWPIKGGKCISTPSITNSILVTGHENGSVKLWKTGPISLQLLYTFHASQIFMTYEVKDENNDIVEEWPPFRKVGYFDSLCDDPRLAVCSIAFNDVTQTIIVGGNAGQVIVLQMLSTEEEKETRITPITISDSSGSTSFGFPKPLSLRRGKIKYERGFHVQCVVQMIVPVPVTCLAFHAEWNLIAAGTFYGFLLYDIVQKRCVLSRCTEITSDNPPMMGSTSPKSKSLKSTFRESFRKLKKAKSLKFKRDRSGSLSSDMQDDCSRESSIKRQSFTSSPDPTMASSPSSDLRFFADEEECRKVEDGNNSVRSVYFAQSFIINNVITTPTLWVGTSNGAIYIYTITMPPNDCRTSDTVTCQIGKEIQLKHQAPVLSIQIIDHRGYPLPDPTDVQCQRAKPADLCGSHRVLLCTEEQIKVCTLPSMKSYGKYKITASEGCRIAKVGFSTFQSKNDPKVSESCVVCLTTAGGVSLYGIPELKRHVAFDYACYDDIGMSSKVVFSNSGHIVCQETPSEFEISSFSALVTAKPNCQIELPEGARAVVPKASENVILDIQNIQLQNGHGSASEKDLNGEIMDPEVQNELNASGDAAEQARRTSLAIESRSSISESDAGESSKDHISIDAEVQSSPARSVNEETGMEMKWAPLATIEELNTSNESYSSFSTDCSRSYYGSN